MGRFDGRAAIVTGGALGIGGATARRLAAEGAAVLIVDVRADAAGENAARIAAAGGRAVTLTGNVADEAVAQAMVERALAEFGRLDYLVQNAYAGPHDGPATELAAQTWDEGMGLLARALYLGARHAIPAMTRTGGGSIVNLASVHGLLMAPRKLVYETGKAAVIALTRQLAIDYGPVGVRVNAIAPGHIVTERLHAQWQAQGNAEGFRYFELMYPVRRCGTPDDIAAAIAFLCSDDASFITGVTLPVDGGLSIQLQEDLAVALKDYVVEHPTLRTLGEA